MAAVAGFYRSLGLEATAVFKELFLSVEGSALLLSSNVTACVNFSEIWPMNSPDIVAVFL